jgi:hypothetical protein
MALRKTILAELSAYGSGLTASGLLELVKTKLPATTLADVRDGLEWLSNHELAAYIPAALDPDDRALRQWTITAAGELALKK